MGGFERSLSCLIFFFFYNIQVLRKMHIYSHFERKNGKVIGSHVNHEHCLSGGLVL